MTELLTIGDFSRMTFLTVKALRHYHDVGLLEPARDRPAAAATATTGPSRSAQARLIRRLRDLDLPVDDVRTVLAAPDEATRNAVMVEHLDRMSRQLEQVQETVDSLRRMLSDEDEEIGVSTATSRPRWCWRSAVTSTATRPSPGGSRRSPSCTGCSGPPGSPAPGRTVPSSRPSSSPRARRSCVAFVPGRPGAGALRPGRGGHPARSAVRRRRSTTARWSTSTAPTRPSARTVVERALASDGPVVERYLPLGGPGDDKDDLLAHRTEVCWPVSG